MATDFHLYFVDSIIRWMNDNDWYPYMVVRTDFPGVKVPSGYAKNDRVLLNLSRLAIRNYEMTESGFEFDARFKGSAFHCDIPTRAVLAVQSLDESIVFSFDPEDDENPAHAYFAPDKHEQARSKFRIVE